MFSISISKLKLNFLCKHHILFVVRRISDILLFFKKYTKLYVCDWNCMTVIGDEILCND